jgi:hydrogenase-4 component E
MSSLLDSTLVLLVLTNLAMLATAHLRHSIRLLAIQGFALGAFVLLSQGFALATALTLAVGVAALKGLVYPRVLVRVQRKVKAESEDAPLVSYTSSFLAGILALGASFLVASSLDLPFPTPSALAMPVALSTIITGLALTITRRTALAQVLGYVVLENGIFLFALILVGDLPLLLELGALLEVFFGVFVMGIAIDRISREFNTIDVNGLTRLKG